MLWQAALEPLPRCSLVCASIKGGGRSLRPAPERRRHRGSGGEEDLGTRRMDDQLRQVTAIETVAGGDKGVAAVQTAKDSLAGSGHDDIGIVGHDRDRMGIELGPFLDILPALSSVLAADKPALLDRPKNKQWIIGAKRETLHVADVRRVGKRPLFGLGQSSELLAIDPAFSAVAALENRRRAGAKTELAGFRMLDQRPCFFVDDALVDLSPGLAAIIAAKHPGSAGRRIKTARLVAIDNYGSPESAFASEPQRARLIAMIFWFCEVKPLRSAHVENAIGFIWHGLLRVRLLPRRDLRP